jgi:hypothetical protein
MIKILKRNFALNVVFSFLFEIILMRNYNVLPHPGAAVHQKQTGQ